MEVRVNSGESSGGESMRVNSGESSGGEVRVVRVRARGSRDRVIFYKNIPVG